MPTSKRGYHRGFSAGLRAAVRAALGGRCARCAVTAPLEIHHRGGGGRAHRARWGGASDGYLREVLRHLSAFWLLCPNHHARVRRQTWH